MQPIEHLVLIYGSEVWTLTKRNDQNQTKSDQDKQNQTKRNERLTTGHSN